ncbi:hypothetical protein JK364_24310 [Streptomyces sp. 110]|uniref:Uncharacterized protein n=1 Tax=Streptomyces endocoffeicus TaxID=2898945 RepID=A0ABS1PSV4_9ACTN|nr:hypothetical protein [Streptomyces endocoffeicus]MBL1115498.1 hypothetical protein [Streptomyces endocoffeicus]
MRASGITVQRGKPHEDAIRRAAQNLGIDIDNQHSYDSGDFPMPITEQQCQTELTGLPDGEPGVIADECCTDNKCGKWLKLGEKPPTEAGLTRWVRDNYELPQALAREIARKLREWGLSHPEFITEDNVRQAAAMFPHDYATVHAEGNPQRIVLMPTPQYDNDPCFYCEQPWEKHTFTCTTCGTHVPADAPQGHEVQVKGQIKFREAKPTT